MKQSKDGDEELVELTVKIPIAAMAKLENWTFIQRQRSRRDKSLNLSGAIVRAINLLSPDRIRKNNLKVQFSLAEVVGQRVVVELLRQGRANCGNDLSAYALADLINQKAKKKYYRGIVNVTEQSGKIDRTGKIIRRFNAAFVADALPVLGIPFSIEEIEKIGKGELYESTRFVMPIGELIDATRSRMTSKLFQEKYTFLGLTDSAIEFARKGFVKDSTSAPLATLLGVSEEQVLAMSLSHLHRKFVNEAEEALKELEELRAD